MTLKFEGIPVGSKIRAYDFEPMPGRGECYAEGVIDSLTTIYGTKAYSVTVSREVWDGSPLVGDDEGRRLSIYVPMEVSFLEYDSRVTVLEG